MRISDWSSDVCSSDLNAIRWMSPGRQLILGTSGGEWSVTSDGPVVTPTDIEVKRESTNGSADIVPLRISSIVLFVQRAKRKLRELVFSLETDGFRTPDLRWRSEEHTSELQSLMRISYAVFCLKNNSETAHIHMHQPNPMSHIPQTYA